MDVRLRGLINMPIISTFDLHVFGVDMVPKDLTRSRSAKQVKGES